MTCTSLPSLLLFSPLRSAFLLWFVSLSLLDTEVSVISLCFPWRQIEPTRLKVLFSSLPGGIIPIKFFKTKLLWLQTLNFLFRTHIFYFSPKNLSFFLIAILLLTICSWQYMIGSSAVPVFNISTPPFFLNFFFF